jgi:hypothetical protein
MPASSPISVFHQRLSAAPTHKTSACAIILHCDDSWPCAPLIREIADYLNEYDDDGDGRWLPATSDMVEKIARDANHRRMLEMNEAVSDGLTTPQAEYRKTLTGLGHRGHVIFRSPGLACEATQDFSNTFHAGVGRARNIPENCHLILNPDLMDQKCIAHIVGDVFLEWLHCQLRRSSIHEI